MKSYNLFNQFSIVELTSCLQFQILSTMLWQWRFLSLNFGQFHQYFWKVTTFRTEVAQHRRDLFPHTISYRLHFLLHLLRLIGCHEGNNFLRFPEKHWVTRRHCPLPGQFNRLVRTLENVKRTLCSRHSYNIR